MSDYETIADIIAEKRRRAEDIRNNLSTVPFRQLDQLAEIEDLEEEANRLEAALKREMLTKPVENVNSGCGSDSRDNSGDCAKLREALEKAAESAAEIMERVRHKDGLAFNTANYIAGIAKDALAAPPRNCDTPYNDRVEMYGAFKDWCNARGYTMEPKLACDAFDWLLTTATGREGGKDAD